MPESEQQGITKETHEALQFHEMNRPGKLEIVPTKPLSTQRDLSLAYSPGVAHPCLHIKKDPKDAYRYTNKGNLVAVISNGTAVLGLGNLGALASKPVMEGKAVLFKRFADIDAIDLEIDTTDVNTFIECVRCVAPSFGGINLEDIRAPDCFVIEQRLQELVDIPIIHDDQHGTAIIVVAALINALDVTGRKEDSLSIVVNGAGAASLACMSLLHSFGIQKEQMIVCDRKGVVYTGRESMDPWKAQYASKTKVRTLSEAIKGADIFIGLSAKGVMNAEMVRSMADNPIIFALANPDPEITPEEVAAVRHDAIIATGRSDYPNQVNNVLGFPYLFRGALDVGASMINTEMKLAASRALAQLAREVVPEEVDVAYAGKRLSYGKDYIIPVPFDPRLIVSVPSTVAQAALQTNVARKPIKDFEQYRNSLRLRLDPTRDTLQLILEKVKSNPQRVVFAEGEEECAIRASFAFHAAGYGTPILIGREDSILKKMQELNFTPNQNIHIYNAKLAKNNLKYIDYLYKQLCREGLLYRDCQRLIHQDRNIFGAVMVALGDADAMVTGLTRSFISIFNKLLYIIKPRENARVFGLSILATREHTVLIADTKIERQPTSSDLAYFAIQSAVKARQIGLEPRVALLSFSSFGQSPDPQDQFIRNAIKHLDTLQVDFEYDGEMAVDVALDYPLMKRVYPFSRLSGAANILIMPSLYTAHISSRMIQKIGAAQVICHQILGLSKALQFVQMGANVSEMVTTAAIAAYDALS